MATKPLPKTVILLGPPGSGKDTQAFALAKRFGYFVLITSDLFRAEISHGTAAGKAMQKIMDQGGLLPAAIVGQVIADEMERHRSTISANGILFDGFPRTRDEIGDAERLIDRYHGRPDLAILLEVHEEELLRRLKRRGRPDDSLDIARERLRLFKKETTPVIDYYREAGRLIAVDGNPAVEEVTKNLLVALGQSPL